MTNDLASDSTQTPSRHLWPVLLWTAQIAIPLKLIHDFRETIPAVGHAATAVMLLIVAASLWPVSRRLIDRRSKQLALAWCSALLTCVLLEATLSTFYANNIIELFTSKTSMMVYEQSAQTVLFDPVRGYRLAETPARFMRFTESKPEYVGTLRGNAQGFPDRDDFTAKKGNLNNRRFAVFGDSFTAAQFIEINWPDRVEELAKGKGVDIELYNVSVDGGGLINWWSVIAKHLDPEGYEFDGVIFAVYPGDLSRRLIVSDHSTGQPLLGRVSSWDPSKLPATLNEAMPFMEPRGVIVNSSLFESILNGTSRHSRKWLPYLTTNYNLWIEDLQTAHRMSVVERRLEDHPSRKYYFDAIRDYAAARRLPVMVVHVPKKHLATSDDGNEGIPRDAERFAETLLAELIDGTLAFRDLDQKSLASCWFDFDPHWTQTGSDAFAKYMADVLATWPANDK
ncbi:MAG: hypothetical protein WD065_16840 [Planctomycetaceae bacterium]